MRRTYRAPEAEAAEVREDWGCLRWLAGRATGNAEHITVGRVTIRPGKSNPRHGHGNAEEILHLLCGELEHTVGDETVRLSAGDTVSIPAGVYHNARNTGETDAVMIVAYPAGEREFRRES
jgi:quercetin dioxygenase-like cupin family protein